MERCNYSSVNLEQLVDSTENLALEIPPLVRENLEGAPETREEIIDLRRGVNQDILITARGKSPRKSGCTLSMEAPAWYLSNSALA